MAINIKIDRKKCISCGLCASLAPKTFKMDKDLKSCVRESGPYDSPAKIKEAAQNCAVGAITVEQGKG